MVQNPPQGYQRVIPYLVYADAPAAIDYLCKSFGFTERMRMPAEDGKIGHAELAIGEDHVVMLATAVPEMGHTPPAEQPGRAFGIMIYVDDVDAHFARAREAGATLLGEPEDQFYGDRSYRARDPEGNEWFFATHVKDVDFSEFEAQAG